MKVCFGSFFLLQLVEALYSMQPHVANEEAAVPYVKCLASGMESFMSVMSDMTSPIVIMKKYISQAYCDGCTGLIRLAKYDDNPLRVGSRLPAFLSVTSNFLLSPKGSIVTATAKHVQQVIKKSVSATLITQALGQASAVSGAQQPPLLVLLAYCNALLGYKYKVHHSSCACGVAPRQGALFLC